MQAQSRPPGVAYGECWCGCGGKTRIATHDNPRYGWIKGEPLKYIYRHKARALRITNYEVRDCGYETPCWVWGGKPDQYGYCNMMVDGRKWRAHVYVYTMSVGPVPEGLVLDHLCRNRACCRPQHLEPVTQAENSRRGANTVLTPQAVAIIRSTPKTYGSGRALAQRFGVRPAAISDVRYGRNWRGL